MYGFSKSLFAANYSCSDLTLHCARIEWSPPASSLGCRRWAQESPGPSKEGTETIKHQDRHHCCPGPESQQLQRQRCHFTPDQTFCLHRSGTLNLVSVCETPRSDTASSRGTKRRGASGGQAQPHIPPVQPLFSIYWCFLRSSSFTFTALFFRVGFFFLFLSYWWRLPLCGKSLHGRWFCTIPLAVACEMFKDISALLGQFSWAPNKTLKSTQETPCCALRSWGLVRSLVINWTAL